MQTSLRFGAFYSLGGPASVVNATLDKLTAEAKKQATFDKLSDISDKRTSLEMDRFQRSIAAITSEERQQVREKFDELFPDIAAGRKEPPKDSYAIRLIMTGQEDVDTYERFKKAYEEPDQKAADLYLEYANRPATDTPPRDAETEQAAYAKTRPEFEGEAREFLYGGSYMQGINDNRIKASEVDRLLDEGKFDILNGLNSETRERPPAY